jgi:hypothetical protein
MEGPAQCEITEDRGYHANVAEYGTQERHGVVWIRTGYTLSDDSLGVSIHEAFGEKGSRDN